MARVNPSARADPWAAARGEEPPAGPPPAPPAPAPAAEEPLVEAPAEEAVALEVVEAEVEAPAPARRPRKRAGGTVPSDIAALIPVDEARNDQVRLTPEAADWLRELRFRYRVPAAQVIDGLVELARERPDLLVEAVTRGRAAAAARRGR